MPRSYRRKNAAKKSTPPAVAQHKKGKGKVPEQLAFDDPGFKEFMKTNLGIAVSDYAKQKKEIEAGEEKLATIGDKVITEMKLQGKTYIRPQIDGVFYDFEIKKTEKEKLFFKRANA